ncbi:McrC family protein [Bacillus sp. UNC437CL72CviS29]|uniref:McrC family protein n=1 Tax=Bacillus sp. UNC437CL72CviS29 TaxID=1340430 RepID=UPI001E57BD20|nr:McrC family protein [Bacillus sp. UNC437CL72CviS29]
MKMQVHDYQKVSNEEEVSLLKRVQQNIREGKARITVLGDGMKVSEKESVPLIGKYIGRAYYTQQYVGVLFDHQNGIRINFGSRFDKNDGNKSFLSYMLKKVFGSKAFIFESMQVSANRDKAFEQMLLFIFVYLLEKAMKKGTFKQYTNFDFYDSNIKGTINFNVYMNQIMIQDGRLPYNVRERSAINPVNIGILTAYDVLKSKNPTLVQQVFKKNPILLRFIAQIKGELPNYRSIDKKQLLKQLTKSIRHPYFTEIESLWKVCIEIIRHSGSDIFQEENQMITGLLIDVNKLWEYFLEHTVFAEMKKMAALYEVSTQDSYQILYELKGFDMKIKPDFVLSHNKQNQAVFDAKHRPAWSNKDTSAVKKDVYQISMYMSALDVSIGGVIYPTNENDDAVASSPISTHWKNGKFYLIPYNVPKSGDLEAFLDKQNEELANKIINILRESKDSNLM